MLPLQRQPDSICILRLSALGDATHVVPTVRAIQEYWPDTQITWIIGALEHRLLSGLDGVEFLPYDKQHGMSATRELHEMLRRRRFDVLLHMQVAARANLLSCLVRAPIRVGWDRARSRDMHHRFIRETVSAVPRQHQVQGYLEFARALGVPVRAPRWDLPIEDEARAWVTEQLPEDAPVLLISPCSSHPLRNWRVEHYARVADHAAHESGMQVILSGGPSEIERETAARIEGEMAETCINLVGKDTLERSKALLERADLVITPDSGPAHIASAVGTPVIGLYAATCAQRSGPYNSLDLCVDHFEEAALKFRKKPAEELRWGTRIEEPGVMDLVTPDEVIARIVAAGY
ncbi:MAG: glycosyltransferase family 9 protein [Xanthomonadales bacterium]|nr:glycosyltransferase family 9 protein [Gammaproteobacteria bacterium]NNJ78140.1 glycosyltransferase family 9 protein [Xanthomonadales bacterium]NNL05791.1 glycosyltransferase family 9 protein [Xanthomonadales bacterium]